MKKLAVLGLVLMMFMSVGYAAPLDDQWEFDGTGIGSGGSNSSGVYAEWIGEGSFKIRAYNKDIKSVLKTNSQLMSGFFEAKRIDVVDSDTDDYEVKVNADVFSVDELSEINFTTKKKSGDDPGQVMRDFLKVNGGYGAMTMGTQLKDSEPHSWNAKELDNITNSTPVTNGSHNGEITQEENDGISFFPFAGQYNLYADAEYYKMGKTTQQSGSDIKASVYATGTNQAGLSFGKSYMAEDHTHNYGDEPQTTPITKISGVTQPWYSHVNSFEALGTGKLVVSGQGSYVKIGDTKGITGDPNFNGKLTQITKFENMSAIKKSFDVEAGKVNNPAQP